MATGTGKTHVFVEYAKQSEGRAMIIAERQEIVMQARNKIAATGETCEIEMGDLKVNDNLWGRPRFVCASIQTLNAQRNCGRRYAKFDWASLKLLVIDEAHHAVAKGYQRVIEHARKENPDIKIMGVTATPDRLDKRSMGNVFNDVAYRYEMDSAIKDGYLVPIRQHMVQVKSMDFSSARTTAGDLNAGDLDRIMTYERNLHGVCVPTMDLAGDRPTLIFAASINHAQRISEIINRHRPGQACYITGKTPSDERAELLREFRDGKYQFLVNVQIATEGWDCPLSHASRWLGRLKAGRCTPRWLGAEHVPWSQFLKMKRVPGVRPLPSAASQTAWFLTSWATAAATSWCAPLTSSSHHCLKRFGILSRCVSKL